MKTTNFKMRMNWNIIAVFFAAMVLLGITSCKVSETNSQIDIRTKTITKQEVADAQKAWGEGIVNIGKVFSEHGDYKAAATAHLNNFYNYQEGTVLFKPTLASQNQFRTDFEGALSYFVAGNSKYPEDAGFAINPWSAVRWENIGTKIIGNMAVAMGNYYFTPATGGNEGKVEYSFAYTKNNTGQLKIILHDSHYPYSPKK
ncbi:phosphoribosyl-AMP cyclohydrolase [Kaistella flava (ex Peng et al. 2021)]|nr:phosphoribosyl-AMP cyclohydrolase [Kaistella flava (ex Peng et al. 2021)]